MGEVESVDYVGKDRRTNGARLKMSIRDWIGIAGLAFGIISWCIWLRFTTDAHSKVIEEYVMPQIKINTARLDRTEVDIANIKENLTYIRGKIDTFVLGLK